MTPRRLLAVLVGGVATVTALSCGDVPTYPDGVAYISSVIAPAPAVVSGDTMRDTLGQVAPLHVISFGRSGETLSTMATRYLITSLDTGVRLGSDGILVATDTGTRVIRLVGQVGDRLQTPELSVPIVRQPDSLRLAFTEDTLRSDPTNQDIRSKPLAVTATATLPTGAAVGVQGVILRYEITRIYPAGVTSGLPDSVISLIDATNRFVLSRPRISIDTTDASGNASRTVRQVLSYPGLNAIDSLEVTVTAKDFRARALKGSPGVFHIRQPKG